MNPTIHLEALLKSVAKANAFSGVQLMWIDFSSFMRFLLSKFFQTQSTQRGRNGGGNCLSFFSFGEMIAHILQSHRLEIVYFWGVAK
jgi:hypothetical protein